MSWKAKYVVQTYALPQDSEPPAWDWVTELHVPDGYELHSWQVAASLYDRVMPRRPFDEQPGQGGRASLVVMWKRVE